MIVRGDRKIYKGRSGGSSYNWDAHERSCSKEHYDKVKASADPAAFLNGLSNEKLSVMYADTNRILRYGDMDWNRIVAMLPDGELEILKARIDEDRNEKLEKAKAKQQQYAEAGEERKMRQVEQKQRKVDDSRLIAGYLHSELAIATRRKEAYGRYDGEWLDDPVAALIGQGGFGEEVSESVGIKLEINLALDCSNSMVRNGLTEVAVNVMRTLYLALDIVAKDLPDGTLTVVPWLWAKGEDGKTVIDLSRAFGDAAKVTDANPLGPMDGLPLNDWNWTGEDTWIYPLLEAICEREEREGDFGAFRLDIILTDGVLEHATDSRRGDAVQDRRDGNLQSVVLNFLPMELWADFRVPNHCVQYEATVENVGSLMRQVLGDWVVGVV